MEAAGGVPVKMGKLSPAFCAAKKKIRVTSKCMCILYICGIADIIITAAASGRFPCKIAKWPTLPKVVGPLWQPSARMHVQLISLHMECPEQEIYGLYAP